MGAFKQKWTEEEKSALKAGVVKHGSGKWRTILEDPEFSAVLCLRSNVDLKDKWRNLSTANGWGSGEKARMALKKSQQIHKQEENQLALSTTDDISDEILDVKPLAVESANPKLTAAKIPSPKIEKIISEAIKNVNEPTRSKKIAIAQYLEVKEKSGIPRKTAVSDRRGPRPKVLHLRPRQKEPSRIDRNDVKVLKQSQIDPALARLRNMTAEEAALIAAQAVSEAEEAMAEAEQAAREAEDAEADAKAAEAFAEAALRTLQRS